MVEEIRQPRFPVLIFGDGTMAQLLNHKEDIDSDGTKVVVLRFRPTQPLRQKFAIQTRELDTAGAVVKKYPKEFFIAGDRADPRWSAWFILSDYIGHPTELSNLNITNLENIRGLKKHMATLKGQLAFMHDTYKKATSEAPEFTQLFTTIQKELTRRKDIDKDEEEKKNPYGSTFHE